MTTKRPSTAAPASPLVCRAALRADLKRETTVSRMCVHGEDAPRDMVCSGAPGAQRYRHLVAADTGLPRIDALAGGIGHGDGAERCFQLLSEPECHLTWRCGDLIADPRFGMIEKSMRSCVIRREQQQQGNYTGKR